MIRKEDIQVDPDTQLVFNIPEENFEKLKAKLAKMSKKAEAQGLPPIFVMPIGFKDEKNECNRVHRTWEVMVAGIAPKIDGWVFNARVDYDHQNGNVIYAIPGRNVPEHYKTCDSICEHCGWKRKRRTGYLLQHEETGEFKLVGSSCLAEFFPQGSPESIAKYFETLRRAQKSAGGFGYSGGLVSYNNIDVLLYLQCAAHEVRTGGWYSAAVARQNGEHYKSTAARATAFYAQKHIYGVLTQEDIDQGRKAKEWLNNLSDEEVDGNTFLHNVRVMARDGLAKLNDENMLAGAFRAWMRSAGIDQHQKKVDTSNSQHQGTVGDKITLDVEVLNTFVKDNFTVHKFADYNGNLYTWFNHGGKDLNRGDRVKITGTVKAHNIFRNTKETVLTRVKEF